jgi:hypothetical protein
MDKENNDIKLIKAIQTTIQSNNGLLFAKPSLVGRHTYLGRNILAPNSNLEENGDERGYVPVEWWISSIVSAGNPILKENEGVGQFFIQGLEEATTLITDILRVAESDVMGKYLHSWPLIKVLDIGGRAVQPNFVNDNGESSSSSTTAEEEEVPPIPAHVHNGYICNGCACGHGKLEAYFFPPLPTGTKTFQAKTRLGVKPGTSKETLIRCMKCFGINDSMYQQLNEYDVRPFSGWTIECGVIHAPGPYPTFEVQLPQDDGNLIAWQMGQKVNGLKEREEEVDRSMLKSAKNEEELFHQVIDYDLTSDKDFKKKFYHPSKDIVIENSNDDYGENDKEKKRNWGFRKQTFFKRFYGEAIQVNPGFQYVLPSTDQPFTLIVWSGSGVVNGNEGKRT